MYLFHGVEEKEINGNFEVFAINEQATRDTNQSGHNVRFGSKEIGEPWKILTL